MDKNKIKNIYFDMDGTFLLKDKSILETNLEAIKILKSHKINVGIATGRHVFMLKREIELISPNLPLVAINGSLIIYKNQKIFELFLDNYIACKLIKQLDDLNLSFFVYTTDHIYISNSESNYYKFLQQVMIVFPKKWHWEIKETLDFELLKQSNIYKILIYFESDDEEKKILTIKKDKCFNFEKSQHNLYDIYNSMASKGDALKFLADNNYIDLNETISFGDNENDISMFKKTKYSVAMGNALDNIKKYATFITDSNENHGIINFIKKYWD